MIKLKEIICRAVGGAGAGGGGGGRAAPPPPLLISISSTVPFTVSI